MSVAAEGYVLKLFEITCVSLPTLNAGFADIAQLVEQRIRNA